MKLLILTYGTEGDTRPLAALGHALRNAVHDVSLLGDASTLGAARELGVPAAALAGDIRELFAKWGEQGPRGTARALVALTNANTAEWMRQTLAAAQGCDAILTSGLAGFVGLSVAERLGVPAIGAGMIPLTPSREFASPFLPPARVPAFLNRASLALTNQLFWLAFRKTLNRARAEVLGLPLRRALSTDHPMLYGISPTLLPAPADWPAQAMLCGQWVAPMAAGYRPPPALSEFLCAGAAPIYVGFGSMTGIDMKAMLDAVIAALDGRRAVFWPGWNGIGDAKLPPSVHCIDATPHDWLFPRMAAVVHHGGSGTSHSALRAGKPSIVMPFTGDQPFWAERLRRLGVAPAALATSRPDAAALAAAFDFVARRSVVERAAALGQRVALEDGLGTAVAAIERLAAQRGAAPAAAQEGISTWRRPASPRTP
ncbi:MAG TPA: glycosyltransferase [Burkholderiaceae bacterium]|nr:glycosyltransferase [Burkholderiaceae bacterium]